MEVYDFLEDVNSMIELKAYHDNIVNLQGTTFKITSCMTNDLDDGIEAIEVKILRNHSILRSLNLRYYI